MRGVEEYREGSHEVWIQVHAKRSAQLKAKTCQSLETWSQFTCVSRRSTQEDGKASIQPLRIHTGKYGEELHLLKGHLLHDSVALCALAILGTLHLRYEGGKGRVLSASIPVEVALEDRFDGTGW